MIQHKILKKHLHYSEHHYLMVFFLMSCLILNSFFQFTVIEQIIIIMVDFVCPPPFSPIYEPTNFLAISLSMDLENGGTTSVQF
jgi:hypothetical protein